MDVFGSGPRGASCRRFLFRVVWGEAPSSIARLTQTGDHCAVMLS
jgi:hypothetical protein